MIFYPSKLYLIRKLYTQYRQVSSLKTYENKFNPFYSTEKRIKADSSSQATPQYSGQVNANAAAQFAEVRLSQCPILSLLGHASQILFQIEDQPVISHPVSLPFNSP